MKRVAVIAGAGPAGLTAAFELLQRSDIRPLVFEADSQVGGISRTVNYRGNRMDLGGHRFFSKSDWVMQWWQSILPVQATAPIELAYQGQQRELTPAAAVAHAHPDQVMLVRSRLSRILYRRRFYDYPLKLNWRTLANLGIPYTAGIAASYAMARVVRRSPEVSLEDFLINRFGEKLYRTFFKEYTEKVWGVPCPEISAEWGAQRIKGLSIGKAIRHALTRPFRHDTDTGQKQTQTSLIERFLYPKFGPGQMWEEVAARVRCAGGSVDLRQKIVGIHHQNSRITAVDVRDASSGAVRRVECEFFISTMPVKELTALLQPHSPQVSTIAGALPYRDFMTAGLLVKRMRGGHAMCAPNGMPPDNWIYVQEPDVKLGRLQIFNNWSPALVADPGTIWLGLEYFCAEGDSLWSMRDPAFLDFASRELAQIGLIQPEDVVDGTVVRVPKAYPAYFGAYAGIGQVREFLNQFSNLFPIGRNGMHRYNNQDHSMLAAKAAVDGIVTGSCDKTSMWSVNVEEDYHEQTTQRQPIGGKAA
jgi:protoporphyrinogen oxidase